MKEMLKKWVKKLPFAFTKNQKYDQYTRQIIRRVCSPESNCIDVGCHKGEVLDYMLKHAPLGTHFGFEPILDLYSELKIKFSTRCEIFNVALSDTNGQIAFNHVISNPAYSGIRKRRYDRPDEQDIKIKVETKRLDDILPKGLKIDLIKIDVEGGEYLVLQGAVQTLKKYKPVVIFEHGLGGADCYGTRPEMIHQFFENCKMRISLLENFDKRITLSQSEFIRQFDEGLNYYFVAHG